METTVYQSNINIFYKSLDLLISNILNINNIMLGLIQLRIGIIGEPLLMRHSTFGFHKP
jgi:hypothetical protein